ncbi:MAG: DUF6316 family protein [Gammaproteobacteria bacterium]|nr:DUF6316 family protein [Gammaproteobacteria bacterium]
MDYRLGETGLLPFRTRRVFNVGAKWYFAVRDGSDCGPFENQQDAEVALDNYLSRFSCQQKSSLG